MMPKCPEEGDVSLQTSNESTLTCFAEENQLESKFLKVLECYLLKCFRNKMFLNVEKKKISFSTTSVLYKLLFQLEIKYSIEGQIVVEIFQNQSILQL